MDRPFATNAKKQAAACCGAMPLCAEPTSERQIVDRLADSFPVERSESEWLLTLLSADDLRYIFEGPPYEAED